MFAASGRDLCAFFVMVTTGPSNQIAKVPWQYVDAAMQRLPPCNADEYPRDIDVDTGLWGRYRITFKPRKQNTPGGRPASWFWLPVQAERLD